MVKTEIEIMHFCRHQNIAKLIDNFEDLENIYIVLEFLSGGNLNYFLSLQQTILPEKKIKEIIYQIGTGIEYLHHFGILHRDLKPENLMMSEKNHEVAIVKIVDFGLSKILGIQEKSNDSYGTLSYAAPEVIQKYNYNNTIDIWSMGIILFFLVCGYLPFNDKNNNVSKIANDITKATLKFDDSIWNSFSPYAKDLNNKCLEKDLNKRINIRQFLDHNWFKEN
jgi:serine/threonine protein kinase